MRRFIILFAILALAGLSFSSYCNTTVVTSSTTLTSDVAGYSGVPVNGACFEIDAPNVVFDCAGHSISYDNSNCLSFGCSGTYGILVYQNNDNVTVKNCAGISGFNYGIASSTIGTGGNFYLNITNNTVTNDSWRA